MWRGGEPFVFPLPYRSWAIEDVLFKVMSVDGHGMSAVEAALAQRRSLLARDPTMDPEDHVGTIAKIEIQTCAAAKLSIDKIGALRNTADRVHCMQYVVSLKGPAPSTLTTLTAALMHPALLLINCELRRKYMQIMR
jgi:2-methylcitrate dehydratase